MTRAEPAVAVRHATASELDALTSVLTEAFWVSPIGDWLIPDLGARYDVYLDYFKIHLDHAHLHGEIHVTDDLTGVALWFDHTKPVPDLNDYDERLAHACGPWLPRFRAIDTTFGRHHLTTPHHYLAFLGVLPRLQRHGIGGALLRYHHGRLDALDMPAYLEASTPHSRDLYRHHGYTITASAPLHLPDSGPPVWPMVRPPATPATARSGQTPP
jgi:GNAT superfamily N-acetyltransferase